MQISYNDIAQAAKISESTVKKDSARGLFQHYDLYSISKYIQAVRFFRDKDSRVQKTKYKSRKR